MENRLFVLDTSVLIHDPESIRSFRNTSVAIPIYVIMELDDLKESKRMDVATSARIVSRRISDIMKIGSLHDPKGVLDPNTNSTFYVIGASREDGGFDGLLSGIGTRKTDLLILKTALRKKQEGFNVVVVTKDVNMRILADSEGLEAEDYDQDKVSPDAVPSGLVTIPFDSAAQCAYQNPLDPSVLGCEGVAFNEFVLCGDHLLRLHGDGLLHPVPKSFKNLAIQPRNLEQRMALDLLSDPEVKLVNLIGLAGTGKTLCALAVAINGLDFAYSKVILSKPVVPMGRELGFLPGTEEEKMAPWMLSYVDNMDQIFKPDNDVKGRRGTKEKTWEQLLHSKKLEIQPLHSIRGRSIGNAFIIADEIQNCTPHEVKTFVSRAAEGTKVVLCGDPSQIDDSYLDAFTNGLVHSAVNSKGSKIAGTVILRQGVRSELAEFAATRL